MTAVAITAFAISVGLAYAAWRQHEDTLAVDARTRRDLATIRKERAALDELHRRISADQARRSGHPAGTSVASEAEQWLRAPKRRTYWVDKRDRP